MSNDKYDIYLSTVKAKCCRQELWNRTEY